MNGKETNSNATQIDRILHLLLQSCDAEEPQETVVSMEADRTIRLNYCGVHVDFTFNSGTDCKEVHAELFQRLASADDVGAHNRGAPRLFVVPKRLSARAVAEDRKHRTKGMEIRIAATPERMGAALLSQ